jgi:hypothetical protein
MDRDRPLTGWDPDDFDTGVFRAAARVLRTKDRVLGRDNAAHSVSYVGNLMEALRGVCPAWDLDVLPSPGGHYVVALDSPPVWHFFFASDKQGWGSMTVDPVSEELVVGPRSMGVRANDIKGAVDVIASGLAKSYRQALKVSEDDLLAADFDVFKATARSALPHLYKAGF